jgi:GNAT superfamily N-acetyltransferase
MQVDVHEESADNLRAYARISIAFEVAEVLDVEPHGSGLRGFSLRRRALEVPYVKDYDAIDGGSTSWPQRFDLSNWCLLIACMRGDRVGGAAVALSSPGLMMAETRADLAILWDIRVAPAHRGRGVGSALIAGATARAAARGCRRLKAETQNVNIPACRLYLRHGFELGAIDRFAYPSLPGEIQLVWYKDLTHDSRQGGRWQSPISLANGR